MEPRVVVCNWLCANETKWTLPWNLKVWEPVVRIKLTHGMHHSCGHWWTGQRTGKVHCFSYNSSCSVSFHSLTERWVVYVGGGGAWRWGVPWKWAPWMRLKKPVLLWRRVTPTRGYWEPDCRDCVIFTSLWAGVRVECRVFEVRVRVESGVLMGLWGTSQFRV